MRMRVRVRGRGRGRVRVKVRVRVRVRIRVRIKVRGRVRVRVRLGSAPDTPDCPRSTYSARLTTWHTRYSVRQRALCSRTWRAIA